MHRPANWSRLNLVFPNGVPRASMLRKDAEKNGVAYRDEAGRYADFHALRHTWGTFLQRNGIAQRYAMNLLRHSDMKLTVKVYTDESQLPIYDAIKTLPRLFGGYTQIRAQISDKTGLLESQPVARSGENKYAKPIENELISPVLTPPVASGQMERAKGFEPSTSTLAR